MAMTEFRPDSQYSETENYDRGIRKAMVLVHPRTGWVMMPKDEIRKLKGISLGKQGRQVLSEIDLTSEAETGVVVKKEPPEEPSPHPYDTKIENEMGKQTISNDTCHLCISSRRYRLQYDKLRHAAEHSKKLHQNPSIVFSDCFPDHEGYIGEEEGLTVASSVQDNIEPPSIPDFHGETNVNSRYTVYPSTQSSATKLSEDHGDDMNTQTHRPTVPSIPARRSPRNSRGPIGRIEEPQTEPPGFRADFNFAIPAAPPPKKARQSEVSENENSRDFLDEIQRIAKDSATSNTILTCAFTKCKYSTGSLAPTTRKSWKFIAISLDNHIRGHCEIALYRCRLCDIEIKLIGGHRLKHRGVQQPKWVVDNYKSSQQLLFNLLEVCFSPPATVIPQKMFKPSVTNRDTSTTIRIAAAVGSDHARIRSVSNFTPEVTKTTTAGQPNFSEAQGGITSEPTDDQQLKLSKSYCEMRDELARFSIAYEQGLFCQVENCSFQTKTSSTANASRCLDRHIRSHYFLLTWYCTICKTPMKSSHSHNKMHSKLKNSQYIQDNAAEHNTELLDTLKRCFKIYLPKLMEPHSNSSSKDTPQNSNHKTEGNKAIQPTKSDNPATKLASEREEDTAIAAQTGKTYETRSRNFPLKINSSEGQSKRVGEPASDLSEYLNAAEKVITFYRRKTAECAVCGITRRLDRHDTVEGHILSHIKARPYFCVECRKVYQSFKAHQGSQHKKRKARFEDRRAEIKDELISTLKTCYPAPFTDQLH